MEASAMEPSVLADGPITETGYWGRTTPSEDEALTKLKDKSKDLPLTPRYDDVRLLRFLRARQFNVDNAYTMLAKDLQWRKENNVDTILETFPSEPGSKLLLEYWPHREHKTDVWGLPFKSERIGIVDVKIMRTYTAAQLLRMHVYHMERIEQLIDEATKKAGKPLDYGVIGIFDVKELGWKHMYTPALNSVKDIVAVDKDHYPEILRKLLIVNSPKIFTVFWKIFKPLIDARTVAKTEVSADDSYQKVLFANMRREDAPLMYGGTCKEHTDCIPGGGPWTLSSAEVSAQGITVGGDAVSHQTTVKARSVFEVPLKIEQAYTTLVWEFSVKAYSLHFKVVKVLPDKSQEVVFDPVDHEGSESFQSQLVVNEAGDYILIWDNTHSKLRSKELTYQIQLLPPHNEEEIHTLEEKTKKKKKKKKSKKKKPQKPVEEPEESKL